VAKQPTKRRKPEFYKEASHLSDLDVLALTLYGEALAGDIVGAIGVGNVIQNRSILRNQSIRDVCHAPLQFSCWNGTEATGVSRMRSGIDELNRLVIMPSWLRACRWIAKGIMGNDVPDYARGADHYVTRALYDDPARPAWVGRMKVLARFGGHVFLKEKK